MSLRLASVLSLPLLVCGACSAPPIGAAPVGVERAPIVGGTSDTGDPGVVLVIAQQASNQNEASLCTGEVVSPHVVMTAAHCVDPATVGAGAQFAVFTGDDINQAANSDFHDVQETHYDTAFNPSPQTLQNGHDIGVVILKQPLSITPLPVNGMPADPSWRGMSVRFVGYGITSGTDTMGTSAGVKRTTTSTLADYDDLLLYFNDPNHLTCEGDSGGPAFMKLDGTNEIIAGITSFGDQGCTMGGADTRVDDYLTTFLQPYINQFDPPPPPDMAQPPSSTSDGGMTTFAPGSVGADCMDSSDCASGICAKVGSGGYCTATCDPTAADSCPTGTHCGKIDGAPYCERNARSSGGCSTTLGAGGSSAGLGLVLGLLLLGFAISRRRLRA